jgi:3-(3-hydroxy-phenyl)propionate hydroxylase
MLSVRHPGGGYQLRGAWLAACDGGQSFVRKSLGLSLEGTAYEGRYVIIDIELHSSHPTERRAWFDPPWNPGSTVLMHRQPDDIWRIDYQLREGQSTEEALQPAAVAEFVQRHLDAIGEGHLPWHTVWTSVYRAGAMTLPSYRHGRVLFAGNAAHAMPIFGVRGLNSGFDDADNLAWKLARVARSAAGTGLLDSYSDERIAAFHVNAENAMRSTEFMSPPSRGFDLLREAALSLSGRHRDIANLINPRQTQAVRYAASPLSSDSDDLPAGPLPGEVMPNLQLGPGSHLSELLQAPGFVVLAVGTEPPERTTIQACSRLDAAIAIHVLHRDDTPETALAALGATCASGATYLLRPDGHVAGRWAGTPANDVLAQALARALSLPASTLSPATLSSSTLSSSISLPETP